MVAGGGSIDGLDLLAEELDVELLVGDGIAVGKVLAVGVVCVAVVFGGLLEEAAGDGEFELVEGHTALLIALYLVLRQVFLHLLELSFWQASVVVEAALEVGEVDPRGDGGFEEGYLLAVAVGVVAKVGVAGLDEDNGLEAYFAEDGGEEDAGIDAVGLAAVPHLVEEAYVLHVGAQRGVGGAGDRGKMGISTFFLALKPGNKSQEQLFQDVQDGVYITEVQGLHAGLNPQSGNFSLQSSGFLIKNGKLDRALDVVTVSGNLMEIFNDVLEVGNDVKVFPNGASCPSLYVKKTIVSGK